MSYLHFDLFLVNVLNAKFKSQIEKLKLEACNDIKERGNTLNLWEKVVLRSQARSNELDAVLQVKHLFVHLIWKEIQSLHVAMYLNFVVN